MEKVCNQCGTHFTGTDSCPHCLATGRGDIRDYHVVVDGSVAPEPAAEPEPEVPEDDGTPSLEGNLEDHPKAVLQDFAASVGVPAHGTKADIVARLQEEGHGEGG